MSSFSRLSDIFHADYTQKCLEEIKIQCKLILPICATFILRKSIDIVSVIFVGLLGPRYLSASGLATVTANVTGNSLIIGFAGALSTQCSQLLSTKNDNIINTLLLRAICIIVVIVNLPVSLMWLLSQPILLALGQSQLLATDASLFLKYLIPGLLFFSMSICIQNWLHSQSKTKLVLFVTVIVAIIHPINCYVFVFTFKLGYLGAAIASSVSKFIEFICLFSLLLSYTSFSFRGIIVGQLWKEWLPFLALGLPGLVMMSEWWASEIIIFLSGLLADPELKVSTMAIYQNTLSICYMVPNGKLIFLYVSMQLCY